MKKLQEKAAELFETHPQLDVVYLSIDGSGFASKMEAQGNASQLKHNAVYEFKRDEAEGLLISGREPQLEVSSESEAEEVKTKSQTPKALELIELIKSATTAQQVDEILNGDKRVTVVEAAEAKKQEILEAEAKASAETE